MVRAGSVLWQYLSPDQRQLAADGQALIEDRKLHPTQQLSDYSYLVFPYAKLYEGFLKQVFRDIGVITETAYHSDHFRIGKVLSPNLVRRLGARSAYTWIAKKYGMSLADTLWTTWKQGRNLVFHYFPHNVRRLTYEEALDLVHQITSVMDEVVRVTGVKNHRQ